jgi:hypothetical protein
VLLWLVESHATSTYGPVRFRSLSWVPALQRCQRQVESGGDGGQALSCRQPLACVSGYLGVEVRTDTGCACARGGASVSVYCGVNVGGVHREPFMRATRCLRSAFCAGRGAARSYAAFIRRKGSSG